MSDILKWGILGCSKFALEHMLPAMQLAGQIRLDPANAAYAPQVYGEGEVRIQGKMAGLLRRY